MTHDVVALLERAPTLRGMTRALVQSGPELQIRAVAGGAVVQLRNGSGRMVAAVQAAQRLASSSEADRLLAEGIADDLPAQPWWVEARGAETGPEGADTAGAVRAFADALVTEFGGLVWEPEHHLDRDDPLLAGAADHPAITRVTDRVALSVQDRPVVPLSTWLVDAVAEHAQKGRAFQLVTPSGSRITHALRSVLGIGVEGVASIGSERALAAPVPAVPVGPPLTHAVWYRIGDGTEGDSQERLRTLMAHLHPDGSPASRQRTGG